MRRTHQSLLAALTSLALVGACSSDDGSTPPPTGSIAIRVTPAGATIQQGGSILVTGTITRSNFSGDIAIGVTGAPVGVSGAVTLAPVGGGSSAQVTLTATTSAPVGTYSLAVVAKGSGVDSATATFTLTIAAAIPASYTMTLGTPSQAIAQGGNAMSTLTFVRTAFSGSITLAVKNLPAGVSAAFSTNPVGGTTSTVTFTATPTAVPGMFNTILIRGTAPGLTDVAGSMTLTVTSTGSFAIAIGSDTLNVVHGNGVSTAINATRSGGFAGAIVYSVTGPANAALPAGLTATISPTATADQSTLTVATAPTLPVATYPIVIHAASFGSEQIATATVVVTAAGNLVTLDYTQCVTQDRPIWVAYQNGSGAFNRVTGASDVYAFTVSSPKAAYATVTYSGSAYHTAVRYFARDEAGTLRAECRVAASGKQVFVSVTGLAAGYRANVSIGGAAVGFGAAAGSDPYPLGGVANGMQDLIGYRRQLGFPAPGASDDRVIIRRDLNVADGGSLAPLDFNNAIEALTAPVVAITVPGASTGSSFNHEQDYLTGAACTPHPLYSESRIIAGLFVYGVPASLQRASDFYRLTVYESIDQNLSKTVATSFYTLAARAVAMPASISPIVSVVSSAMSSYRLLQAVVPVPADYQSTEFSYEEWIGSAPEGVPTGYTILQSSGYLGGAATATMTAVDFGNVAGYSPSWGPSKSSAIRYRVTATGGSTGSECVEGATTKSATFRGIVPLT